MLVDDSQPIAKYDYSYDQQGDGSCPHLGLRRLFEFRRAQCQPERAAQAQNRPNRKNAHKDLGAHAHPVADFCRGIGGLNPSVKCFFIVQVEDWEQRSDRIASRKAKIRIKLRR